jgi:hypothetical protein
MSRGYTTGVRGGQAARSEAPRVKGIDFMASGRITKMKLGRFPEAREARPSKVLEAAKDKNVVDTEKVFANEDLEHAAVFKDGKQIFLRTDESENSVNFTLKELNAMKDAVFTHNHPVVEGVSFPFSRADILMMRDVRAQGFRAVAGNTTFVMEPPKGSKFWKTNFGKLEGFMQQVLEVQLKSRGVPGNSVDEMFARAKPKDAAAALDAMLTLMDKQLNIGYKKLKS